MPAATIKLFLVHGDPKRLRTAELSNWTGKAIAGSRAELEDVLGRDESSHSGVYFLIGSDPASGDDVVYIGEAEVIRDRIKYHLDKDFWNALIFIISKDEHLTKAHIRHLEGKLIDLAKASDRASVQNANSSGSKLPESDRADMQVFLASIQQLLPVLGADFLVPIATNPTAQSAAPLRCEIKGLLATGIRTANGFVVFQGSKAVLNERPAIQPTDFAYKERTKLKQDGVLKACQDHLEFIKDTEFSSPSAAASVVHGGTANGLISWKTVDGVTLRDLEIG